MIYGVGEILDGTFRILAVYEGGMALVYVLEDMETGKKAAAKTLQEQLIDAPTMAARFRRETRIWVGLGGHPNIVRAFFVKDIESNPFLFMEYMDGGSLFDLIKGADRLPIERIMTIALAIAEGMDHVHNRITPEGLRGILHRDLKPPNILLGENGDIKIADFGLAGARNATLLTRTQDVLGTIHYSSPEQILDSHMADKRSDIYSFGAVLYHLACGVLPFDADGWAELVTKIKEVAPTAPLQLREDLPEPLSEMIVRCMAKRKEDRFDSFSEICASLSDMSSEPKGKTGRAGRRATRELNEILDLAQREARQSGHGSVEPAHLLLAVASSGTVSLSAWLERVGVKTDSLIERMRTLMEATRPKTSSGNIKFKRSSRRVIGVAQTLAERDGRPNPRGEHVLKALLREPSARDILTETLRSLDVEPDKIEDFLDESEGLFELFDTEGP